MTVNPTELEAVNPPLPLAVNVTVPELFTAPKLEHLQLVSVNELRDDESGEQDDEAPVVLNLAPQVNPVAGPLPAFQMENWNAPSVCPACNDVVSVGLYTCNDGAET